MAIQVNSQRPKKHTYRHTHLTNPPVNSAGGTTSFPSASRTVSTVTAATIPAAAIHTLPVPEWLPWAHSVEVERVGGVRVFFSWHVDAGGPPATEPKNEVPRVRTRLHLLLVGPASQNVRAGRHVGLGKTLGRASSPYFQFALPRSEDKVEGEKDRHGGSLSTSEEEWLCVRVSG
jgi:hypothetical protein